MCNTDSPTCALNGACAAAQYWVGGAVNTANGNHSYQVQDLGVPAVGGALTFKRTYASQHAAELGPLGSGWTHNYNMHLEPAAPDEMVVVITGDGSRLRFFGNGDATFTPYPGVQGTLELSFGAYKLTDSTQTTYWFHSHGFLQAIVDPQGHVTTLTYPSIDDPVSQVTGPGPEGYEPYLVFYYVEGTNKLEEVCDHTGRCVSFTYENEDLQTATDVRGYEWEYTYTGAHLLDEVWDPNDQLVEKTEYEDGRAVRQWSGASVDPTLEIEFVNATTRVVTDGRDNEETVYYDARNTWTGTDDAAEGSTVRAYDANFNITYLEDANENATEIAWSDCGCRPEVITDALGYETRMLYDGHNNLISTTDSLNHTTLYTYSNGTVPPNVPPDLLIETRDALGHHTYYTYSFEDNSLGIPAGLLTATLAPGGQRTHYYYDVYGQLTATVAFSGGVPFVTTTYGYDDLGRQISTTQAAGTSEALTTVTFYDGGGYVTRTVANCTAGSYAACRTVAYSPVHPDENIVTAYDYDGVGNRLRVTNTLGIVTRYDYDASNRLIRVTENYQDGHYDPLTPDEDITTTYGYDTAGNQVVVTDSAGFVTRTFYDELNRPLTVTQNYVGSGAYVPYNPQYPDRNVSTSYGYDPAGNQVTMTNSLGMVTLTGYDQLNRPAIITQNYTTTTPNPDPATYNLVTRYSYDAGGNQTRVTDPRGVATCYQYDALNRVTAVAENCVDPCGLPGPVNVTTAYEYDAAGNRTMVINPQGVKTRYDYDDLDQLVQIWENYTGQPQGTDDESITQYRYDLRGNRTHVIDSLDIVTLYEYDALSRLITTTANYGAGMRSPDRNVVTIQRYDGLGRRTRVLNPLGVVTRYDYDDLGRLVRVCENFAIHPNGQSDENVVTNMTYDQRGNRTAIIDPEDYITTYDYDALSRLITVTDPLDHETVYAYDAAGNRTSVTDANENTTDYAYDELGRVLTVTDALGNKTCYTYDAAGNRTVVTDAADVTTRYDYDPLGRLITVTENYIYMGPANADTNVVTAYGYDRLGNLTAITNARDYVTTYTYDALSRLQTETDPLDHSWAYVYDALGRRTVLTDAAGVKTTYIYDALSRLRAVTYGDTVTATYAYNALGQRIAMTDTTGVTRYGYDDLGRTTGLTHTVGQQVDYTLGYRYDARSLRTGLVYPDNSVISYTYDAAARLTTVIEDTTAHAAYQYDPAGRLTQASFPNGVAAAYAYDTANHLTGITYEKSSAGIEPDLRARYAYTYDEVGNRTRAVETVLYAENEGQAALPGQKWLAANQPASPADPRRAYSGKGWSGLLFAPLPQPPQPPITRERGNYRAAFDADGLRFSPRHPLLGDTEYKVAYRLTVVRRGNDVILHPGHEEPVLVGENLVQYWRGDTFAEEYALTASGVEQRFLFLAPITGTGDLVVEGNLTGDLEPVLEPNTGEITFRVPGTDDVVASYGRAVVQDATGRRQLAQLELNGAHLRIVVPGDWLAQAQYPIVVDPLIGPNFAVSTQEILSDQAQTAAAYGGDTSALVVWATYNGTNGWDISGQLVGAEGQLLSPTIAVCDESGNQQYPAVAGNLQTGGYLVVWQFYSKPTGWDLYGQLLSSDGALVGSPQPLCTDEDDQTSPALAYDSTNNRYLLVWQDTDGIYSMLLENDIEPLSNPELLSTSGSKWAGPAVTFNAVTAQYLAVWPVWGTADWNLAGRLVAADGTPQGEEEIGITSATGHQNNPAVAAGDPAGHYLVVYQTPNAQGWSNIYGQALAADGTLLGLPVAVAGGAVAQGSPAVVYGANLQECLVIWDQESSTEKREVHGRRMEVGPSVGVPRGDEFAICSGDADQRYPALLYNDAAAEYLAVWEDARLGNDWDIYARRVAVDGSLPGNDFLVSATLARYDQSRAAVAYGSAAGQYLVVWQDGRGVEGDDIYAQFVGGGGALVGAAFTVTRAIRYDKEAPAVAYDALHDEYLVVWQEYGVEQGQRVIAGRRVAGDGTLLGTRLEISAGSGTCTAPAVAFNPAAGFTGEWLVVWEDTRNGNYDLYGQRVATTGLVGNAIALWPDNPYPQRYPDVAAAGAGGYLVVVEHQILGDSDVYGVYLDTLGQPVGDSFAIAEGSDKQAAPAVAYSAAEAHYLVVWREESETSLCDIWGRFLPLPIGAAPPADAFSISTSGELEEAPDVACGAAVGEWYVAWQSKASELAPYDVEGGVLNTEGVLLNDVEVLATAAQSQIGVALAYDPARSRYLTVWTDSRNDPVNPDIYAQLARGYSLVIEYAYDGLYRLTEAAYSDGAYYGYAYDAVGNRTSYTNATAPVTLTTYTYDAADRLTAVTRAGVQTGYTWSDRGELLSDGTQNYGWDAAGRLTHVTGTEYLVDYTYDGANNRVGMNVNGTVTAYVVDPFSPVDSVAQVLRETTGGQSTRHLYGLDLFAQQEGATTTYLGYDALSVRLQLDADGAIAATYRYGPYGEVVGVGPEGYGYTGEQWDHYIKMTFLRARYYQPETGRFVSRDRLAGSLTEPSSQHRFVYASDNPMRYRDPRGLYQEGEIEAFVTKPFFTLGPEPWLLEALQHPLVSTLLTRMQGRILPRQGWPYGEFTPEAGGTLSSLYQATRDEATALLAQDGVCGMTSLPLEAAHLSLIVLAGMAAREHQPYRPKSVWEYYPQYLPDGRPLYEPGWDKTGHFFNHAFLTFEFLYAEDRGYPEAADLSLAVYGLELSTAPWSLAGLSMRNMIEDLEAAHGIAALLFGVPYESSLSVLDTVFGPYTLQDLVAFDLSRTIGHSYEFLSTPLPVFQDIPWWTQEQGLPFETSMITQGLFDQGLWRDLTANKRGAKFGIRAYHNPVVAP